MPSSVDLLLLIIPLPLPRSTPGEIAGTATTWPARTMSAENAVKSCAGNRLHASRVLLLTDHCIVFWHFSVGLYKPNEQGTNLALCPVKKNGDLFPCLQLNYVNTLQPLLTLPGFNSDRIKIMPTQGNVQS